MRFEIIPMALLGLWISIPSSTAAQHSPVVQTSTGPLRGRLISIAPKIELYEFLGIPYAEPPIGQLRFSRPVAKRPWNSTWDASQLPKPCAQNFNFEANLVDPTFSPNPDTVSEDCLYLNIWVPKKTLDSGKLATAAYTFIHGGGFEGGEISAPLAKSGVFAGHNDIVVATIQYRLGFIGFAYDGTNGQGPAGNMGLWDQLEALKWLCENFAAFGADCEKHTIGGQSAGAVSSTLHMLSHYSRPFFRRAILQSGSAFMPSLLRTPEVATFMTAHAMASANNGSCTSASDKWQCLKDLPTEALLQAQLISGTAFAPVIDGDFLPRHPAEMLKDGDVARYPTLAGFNQIEGSLYLFEIPYFLELLMKMGGGEKVRQGLTFSDYEKLITSALGITQSSHAVLFLTPILKNHYWPVQQQNGLPSGPNLFDAVSHLVGDYGITCPTLGWMDLNAAMNGMGNQTWAYHYTHQPKRLILPSWMGVTHSAELPLVYGEPMSQYAQQFGYSVADRMFSRILMTYWANFVKNGDPNVGENFLRTKIPGICKRRLRPWPSYVGESCKARFVDLSSTPLLYSSGAQHHCGIKARDCSFWNDLFPKFAAALAAAGG